MRRAARCLAASASLVSLLGGTALAAVPVKLDWRAPPGCPNRERVLSEVASLVTTAPAKPLRVRAVVTVQGDSFQVAIELAGAAHGVRTLRARSCESIARATALIIALAIDPQAAAVVSEETEIPVQPEPVSSEADPATTRAASASPKPGAQPLVFLGFLGEHALVPQLALGGEAGVGLAWRFARADVAAGVIPRGSTTLAGHPRVSGQFTLAFLALRACGGHVDDSLALLGCATMRGSRVWARGKGVSPSFEQVAHVVSLDPGMLFRLPGALRVGTELSANLVIPLIRPTFVIADGDTEHTLFRPATLGAVIKLAVSYEF
jgi:hypothetical protein